MDKVVNEAPAYDQASEDALTKEIDTQWHNAQERARADLEIERIINELRQLEENPEMAKFFTRQC